MHGIVGNNHIFDFLVRHVPEHVEVRCVSLKGHGGDALAFSRASMRQWKAQVEEAVADLSTRCDRVWGAGHSMGCLLLLSTAAHRRFAGLFLMNPPLAVVPRFAMLANALKVATGRIGKDPVAQAAKDAYGISVDFNPFHYYGWPVRYLELFREIRRIRKFILDKVKCPVVAFLSNKDEMVSLASEPILCELPHVTVRRLPESTHYFYSSADRDMLVEEFRIFCER